jgi:hypothetical protein
MATKRGGASIDIAAPPEKVYDLISDVTRMGEWSPETRSATWLDGANGPAVGARFKGTNRLGPVRWSTKPTVEVADPGREFTFVVTVLGRKATRWSYKLAPTEAGTHVEETWSQDESIPTVLRVIITPPRAKMLDDGCAKTLAALKQAAER